MMADNNLDDNEINALMVAYAESKDSNINPNSQSKIFKFLILFINTYVFFVLALYGLFRSNLIQAVDPTLIDTNTSILLDGRAQIFFWMIILMNISVYFNIGFRLLCIISVVSLLNTTLDYLVLIPGVFSFYERPYFSVYIASRPLLIFAIAWAGFSYKDGISSN